MKVTDAEMTRRGFVQTTLAAGVAATAGTARTGAVEAKNGVPYRALGKTEEQVSAVGLGGFHIGVQATEEESIKIIRTALDGAGHRDDRAGRYAGWSR